MVTPCLLFWHQYSTFVFYTESTFIGILITPLPSPVLEAIQIDIPLFMNGLI